MEDQINLTNMVVDIVGAFVSNNSVPSAELPALITSVHKALVGLNSGEELKSVEPQAPAVSVKKSIGSDFIICLEDGRKFKSLKRHLRTKYNMTPEEYRAKWNLPKDYPMVAPAYAEARSNLAKQMGLGQGGRVAASAATAAKRGRKPAVKAAE
jgi:predicted transcriptional regulator